LRPIPEENWKVNGVGIRRNGDNDNANLIRTDINITPTSGIRFVLKKTTGPVTLWESPQKGGMPFDVSDSGTIITSNKTLWAEYTNFSNNQVTLTLSAEMEATGESVSEERLVYKPFNSVVIVLGGRAQQPADPIQNDTHGIFQWAIDRYREGYNVYMYNESDSNPGVIGATYMDLVNSINNHRTINIAIVGYSYGGGSTFVLSERVNDNVDDVLIDIMQAFNVVLTGYVDAIQDQSWTATAERRRPWLSQYHVNFFQRNTWVPPINGAATDIIFAMESDQAENHHIDPNGNRIDHFNIDDDRSVLQTLEERLKTRIPLAYR